MAAHGTVLIDNDLRNRIEQLAAVTVLAMNNLALLYSNSGKLDEAIQLLADCSTKSKALFGPTHPVALNALKNLAALRVTTGEIEKSVEATSKLLKIFEASWEKESLAKLRGGLQTPPVDVKKLKKDIDRLVNLVVAELMSLRRFLEAEKLLNSMLEINYFDSQKQKLLRQLHVVLMGQKKFSFGTQPPLAC